MYHHEQPANSFFFIFFQRGYSVSSEVKKVTFKGEVGVVVKERGSKCWLLFVYLHSIGTEDVQLTHRAAALIQ